ncbi:putative capsular polysaccharide synthesis family protein [Vibrio parahaemolyticus]|uniref:putative capsular polysaccharide synthesis family protein n=1 Tax=Vibrio parahaemolyticus TaxID=670 RepID=UPI001B837F59|nr:putative capsular polysaccharide synthesis family protein [Vibrio parahaemolyticus]MDF5073786.1 putative capsular polysaccharide synthesis family protein [Vibrio parahaemolyticus]MDF5410468.1 putative capsular polysaccharide synthesis family protein [Vibrio parahaemolyticus]MDF5421109.1 putative capsular polysaccharide synthesis family protein [Vibrio parahaemolyticus]HBC3860871.1 putative capsular polysaccharide synthesis family protein [Vibrio parahaemolyticus]
MKYSIARQFEKNRELRADNFVLVYQMGKVGSSSIEHTLEARNIPSYHIHTFDDHEEFHMYHNKKDVSKFFDFKNRAMYRLVLNQRKRILQKREQIKIVTLIRDPIATVFSRFFQDLHLQFIEGKKNDAIHRDMEVTYKHLEHCFDNYINLNYFADWFDNELKRNFSIDVMRQEIDSTQPFFTFNNDKASVILIKCEQLSSLDKEIGDFLNVDNFVLKNSNEAKNKWYSNIHQYFKQHYDFSKLFYMYDLPLYRHIYSQPERETFKTKWLKTPGTKSA